MGLKSTFALDTDVAEQLAGVTGLGWTTSSLGFLSTVLGYGNSVVGRLVTDPQSLLYVGFVCFLATLGLDRVAKRATETDSGETAEADERSAGDGAVADGAAAD